MCLNGLSRAFGVVYHRLLLAKPHVIFIKSIICHLIADFPSDRTLRARVNGDYSLLRHAISDIQQGPALGPLLFQMSYMSNQGL